MKPDTGRVVRDAGNAIRGASRKKRDKKCGIRNSRGAVQDLTSRILNLESNLASWIAHPE
jgi:hypothetical protein